MSPVLNFILFILFSVWLCSLSGFLVLAKTTSNENNISSTHIALGVLLMYALAMICKDIKLAFFLQVILSLAGSILFFRRNKCITTISLKWHHILFFIFIMFLSMLLIDEPLKAWDARSIWFYHSKVIYFTGDVWAHGDWKGHANTFSHLDYPKLLPLLAAQAANYFNIWNEHVPKAGLLFLSLPIIIYVFEYTKGKNNDRPNYFKFFLIILTLFLFDGSGFFLTSGYMDGWLSVYAFCTSLIAIDTVSEISCENKFLKVPNFIVFGTILSQLKQEGIVLLFCILSASIIAYWLMKRNCGNKSRELLKIECASLKGLLFYIPFIIIVIISLITWNIGAKLQGLSTGNHFIGNVSVRIIENWNEPGVTSWIFSNILFHNSLMFSVLFLGVFLSASILLFKVIKFKSVDFIPLFAGLTYLLILFFVYHSSSADVFWHMSHSAGRAGLSASMLIIAFNYRIITLYYDTIFND